MAAAEIDKRSPIPFYFQLKTLLRKEIVEQSMEPGDRLSGDHQLCERFGVSRTVVRQALTELEYEGVLERVRGRGTFVAAPKESQGLVQSLRGLHQDVALHGHRLRSDVRRMERVLADDALAADFGVEPGTELVQIERLRHINDVPWVLTVTYLPVDLVTDLTEDDLRTGSLYAWLEERGVRLVRSHRGVEARVASSGLARDLGLAVGAPVLFLSSVSADEHGRIVEVFHAFHRGDRSRFEVDLTAENGDPTPSMMVDPTL
ncbi:MAG: GntR family transcriptional regulator [Propionibacteriaceae bacterium]